MDYSEKILDLFSGDISEEDKNKLIQELENNEDLQADFRLQKEILHAIEQGDDDTLDFRSQLKEIGNEFIQEKRGRFRIRPAYWLAAASVISILTVSTFLGLFRNDPYMGDQLFMEYYQPYGVDIKVRGEQHYSALDRAISLYQAGNMASALNEFNRLELENSELSGFFSALCQIELGNIESAEKELESISQKAIFYADHINWYLSLCYLKQEEISKAKAKFEDLSKGDNMYSQRASEILKKLN